MMTYYSIAPNGGIIKEIDRDVDVEAIAAYQAYRFGYYARQEGRKLGRYWVSRYQGAYADGYNGVARPDLENAVKVAA